MKFPILLLALTAAPSLAVTTVVDLTALSPNQATFNLTDTGQTFTTGSLGADTSLLTVGLEGPQTWNANEEGDTLTIEIWSDTDGNHATWDPGSLLGTSTNSLQLTIDTVSLFNFTGVTLADNTVYTLRVLSDDASGDSGSRFGLAGGGDLYPDGTLFNGGSIPFGNGFDASIVVTTVPEPSIALLGGLGLLGLLRRRR